MTSSAADLLEVMRHETHAAAAAEVRRLRAVIDWSTLHTTDEEADAAFGDHGIPLAGPGAPWVSEFAVMELGAALGMSTDSAKRYVGAALEVRFRLPRLWGAVDSGRLPFWKARWIAEHTMSLSQAAASFVDERIGAYAHRISYAEIERQINAAVERFDPENAEKRRREEADGRHFTVHKADVTIAGSVEVTGTLDARDAHDLDLAVGQRAEDLKTAGSTESLDVRRAQAVGDLARGYDPLPFDNTSEGEDHTAPRPRTKRTVELVVHLHADTVFGNPAANVGRCETTRTPINAETIRQWCGNPDTIVRVRPVLDLADHVHVAAYEHPDRLVEQDEFVDLTCVFPYCTRPAPRCDKDHAIAYDDGGPTCSCNSAPLCRGHHRLKTHGAWSYDVLDRGTYLWHSPHGHRYRRDHTGTEALASRRRP
ncbi:HNH endonuclease signature motif containing protein [Nocardioides lijunqiniae]|uniref:HNH endonuclease signature motif containing protein n=1 Tax=Nocardioides lijunqiniae TaxID=2760832 RepID=UPI001878F9CE|nr:HNH endonuclease signature motif containing protein [Nocardioides lijunqiniae]